MNSFRIISSVIIHKFAILLHEKRENIIDMHYQKAKSTWFLNNVKWHSLVIWMFTTFREHGLLPEKQKRSHCSFMHAIEEKTFLPFQMQRHDPIIWAKPNWTSFDICTQFYLSTSPSRTRVMEFIIMFVFIWSPCLTSPCNLQVPPWKLN